jgi:hypothetical protein
MSIRALSLGTFATIALSLGGAATANAGSGHHRFHNFYSFDFRPHTRLVLISPSYDCGTYYDRWQYSGSFYWKKRYFECRGWW